MITIGIRVEPKEVHFAVFDTAERKVINVERIKVPTALSAPERLKYIRSNILDILNDYNVENAGIRITESNAQKLSIDRIQIEGVIQESFASSELKNFYIGQISSISSKLGIDRADFKPYVDGKKDLGLVSNWKNLKALDREALLCAIGAEYA